MSSDVGVRLSRGLKLFTANNPKVLKGGKRGYATAILHLAPAWESGRNTCAAHSAECAADCLFFAGRGAMKKIQAARIERTRMFFEEREKFMQLLRKDITTFFINAIALNLEPVYRLNGTSDIRWEVYGVPQEHPDCNFYDYTKLCNRKGLPKNYHLTYSFSGHNLDDCRRALAAGMSVAVPFLNTPPPTWLGYPTIDGDEDDLRFLGDGPHIVALKAKGRLRNDPTSKFLGDNHHV